MAGEPQPLVNNQRIVDTAGMPTDYFIRWAQARQIDISGGITAAEAQALIDDWAASRSIIAGVALSGGGNLSADRTIDLEDTAVTPGIYGDATHVGQFTVDQQGRISAASQVAITGGGGGGIGRSGAPGLIPDLVFWWEADDLSVTTGFPVSFLMNGAPKYPFTAYGLSTGPGATLSATLLNSLPTINFNADSGYLLGGISYSLGSTIFAIYAPNALGGDHTIVAGPGASLQFRVSGGFPVLIRTGIAAIGTATASLSAGVFSQICGQYLPSTGAYSFRVNRAAAGSGTNVQSISAPSNSVGYNYSNSSEFANGKLVILIGYGRVLTPTEIASVEAYLLAKYGV